MPIRLDTLPTIQQLTEIEQIVLVDVRGREDIPLVPSGVCCVVGEFADQRDAWRFDESTGVFTEHPTPVQILGSTDFTTKLGGYDATIGDHGNALGNGFAQLQNVTLPSLIVVVVPTAATRGIALSRQLPLSRAVDDARPLRPVEAARVPAGAVLLDNSANLVLTAGAAEFAAEPYIAQGTGLTQPTGAATDTYALVDALVYAQAEIGQVMTIGSEVDAAGEPADSAGTYEVVSKTGPSTVTVRRLAGPMTITVAIPGRPWRIYPRENAFTADAGLLDGGTYESYSTPVRPLTAEIAAGAMLTPQSPPDAGDPLGGLRGHVHSGHVIARDADVHRANAPNHAKIDRLYRDSLAVLNTIDEPGVTVTRLITSRSSDDIRQSAFNLARDRSRVGLGIIYYDWVELSVVEPTTLTTSPEVDRIRGERAMLQWPGVQRLNRAAEFIPTVGADGALYEDGVVDGDSAIIMMALHSTLPPEKNPSEHSDQALDIIERAQIGYQRGLDTRLLSEGDEAFKALRNTGGVNTLRKLRVDGRKRMTFQSGITTSTNVARKPVYLRAMRDFLGDTIAQAAVRFQKVIAREGDLTPLGVRINALLERLKGENRIKDYQQVVLDLTRIAENIVIVPVFVQVYGTADFILIQLTVTPDTLSLAA